MEHEMKSGTRNEVQSGGSVLGTIMPEAEYVSPKATTINEFAQSVCEALAVRTGDAAFRHPQTIRWLADFLDLAARIQAKHLNTQHRDAGQFVDKEAV
jgi:hypothetical protein